MKNCCVLVKIITKRNGLTGRQAVFVKLTRKRQGRKNEGKNWFIQNLEEKAFGSQKKQIINEEDSFQYRLVEYKEISKKKNEFSIAEINPEMKWKKDLDKNI